MLPDDYVLLTLDLRDLPVETVSEIPGALARFGDGWLQGQRTPVLQVPSVIVPECTNLLLNRQHPLAGGVRIVAQRRFTFDPRLWLRE